MRTISETATGVYFSHSGSVYGHIILVEHRADGYWYKIQASDCGREISQLIPEHRVVAQSKAFFDDRIIDTRAASSNSSTKLKRQLAANVRTLRKQGTKIAKLQERIELAEENLAEFQALKRDFKKKSNEIKEKKEDNARLCKISSDREVQNALQIFSRTGPPDSASKVSRQLRDLFLGKISEEKSRTAEAQELMDRLAAKVTSLTG